jgi:hypothetical protein
MEKDQIELICSWQKQKLTLALTPQDSLKDLKRMLFEMTNGIENANLEFLQVKILCNFRETKDHWTVKVVYIIL